MTQTDPIIVFLHIPKAAGTTLVSIIEQEYRSSALYRFRHARPIDRQADEINAAHTAGKSYGIVTGHIGYGLAARLTQPVSHFTMLRDPIALLISRYGYRRSHPKQHPVLAEHAKSSSLLEFADSIEDNTMTRFLSGAEFAAQASLGAEGSSFQALQIARVDSSGFQGDPPCDAAMLERAKNTLRDHCAAFGLTERFDESVLLLAEAFGWSKIHYQKQNVGRRTSQPDPLSAEALEHLRARNAFDIELYDYACGLFEERIAERGEAFQQRYGRFKSKNALLGRVNTVQTQIKTAPRATVRALRKVKNRLMP